MRESVRKQSYRPSFSADANSHCLNTVVRIRTDKVVLMESKFLLPSCIYVYTNDYCDVDKYHFVVPSVALFLM